MVETDYYGRVLGWKQISKKPFNHIRTTLGARFCSKCGKLYMDSWSAYCSLDGKWLVSSEQLDFDRRKLVGFDKPSRLNKLMVVDEMPITSSKECD